jgi:excisionase family DNA binding protein
VSQLSTGVSADEFGGAFVVRPARAAEMLSCSRVHVYELMASKDLKSFRDGGGARKITVASIRAYIKRKLSEAGHVEVDAA